MINPMNSSHYGNTMVPNLPGNGKYDFMESLMSGFGSLAGMVNPLLGLAFNGVGSWINSGITNSAQDRYMERYGGPQAQMSNMVQAGINPFTAAQGVAGVSGNSNVSTSPIEEGLAGMMNDFDNALTNPLRSAQVDADTGLKHAQAEGAYNRIKVDNAMLGPILQELDIDNSIKSMFRDRAAELYDLDIKTARQQWYNLQKEFDKLVSDIRKSNSDIELNSSEVGLNEANASKVRTDQMISAYNLACKNLGLDPNDPVALAFKHELDMNGLDVTDWTFDELMDAYEKFHYKVEHGSQEGKNTSDVNYDYGMYYEGKLVKTEKQIDETQSSIRSKMDRLSRNLRINGINPKVKYDKRGHVIVQFKKESISGLPSDSLTDPNVLHKWQDDFGKLVYDYNNLVDMKEKNRQRGVIKSGKIKVPFM